MLLWLISKSLSNLTTGLNTAGMSQTDAQNQINANVAAYNYGQILPWNHNSAYSRAQLPALAIQAAHASTSQPYFQNTGANVEAGVSTAATVATAIAAIY